MSEANETVTHACGAKTSDCPRLDLIPYNALVRLAARFKKGEERYGHNNWRGGLTDKSYVLERAAHVLNHTLLLIGKLEGTIPDDGDDDAGAIMWGGAFLCEAMEALEKPALNCSGCGGAGKVTFATKPDGGNDQMTCPACKGTGKQKAH